jgi:hypothetical protein
LAHYENPKNLKAVDYEVIEEITMEPKYAPWMPVDNRRPTSNQSNNIYIENDEVLDIVSDPPTLKKDSEDQIFGDTGDHSFRRDAVTHSPDRSYMPDVP